jgi:type IV secretion system protein VirD4
VSALSRMTGYSPSRDSLTADAEGMTEATPLGGLAPSPSPAPVRWAQRKVSRSARSAAPYGLAVGGVAALSAATHAPDWFTLMAVGGCVFHYGDRVAEHFMHFTRGGRYHERRLRKYRGEAGLRELRGPLSVHAAQKEMGRLAPTLHPSRAHIEIGRSVRRPVRPVVIDRAQSALVVAPPQTVKTAWLSRVILDAPGAVLATSSRADQWRQTVAVRERLGPVLVLDADGRGPGTNFGWNPVDGCENPTAAMRIAGALMAASPRDPSGKDSWHEDRGRRLMQLAFHAAALVGEDICTVRIWCQRPEIEEFEKALLRPGAAPGWADTLSSLLGQEPEFLNSATTSAEAALGWLDDPELARVACPGRAGLDIARFLRQGNGTVYLIGKHRAHGSLTPFFTTFVSEYMEAATALAERQGGRLAIPMTLVLDEAATTARVDLAQWLAVTAGYNITVLVGLQNIHQLAAYWGGQDQAEIILGNLTTKIIGGGVTGAGDLEQLSVICGDHRVWRKENGVKVHETARVFPPERIRLLPRQHVLVVHRNTKALEVLASVVWEHPLYTPVTLVDPDEGGPAEAEDLPVALAPYPADGPVGVS